MRNTWLEVLDRVLKPARPDLARCQEIRERDRSLRKASVDALGARMASCEARINAMRHDVFTSNDGVVGKRMTELEREWRLLHERSSDLGMMDLWAQVAPASWIDRKRWRDSAAPLRLDAMIALASDVENVEKVEAAVHVLMPKARVRWRMLEKDNETAVELLGPTNGERSGFEVRVHTAAIERFPERPGLARDITHAALVERMSQLASGKTPRGVCALKEIWMSGYVISEASERNVVVEIPPLA